MHGCGNRGGVKVTTTKTDSVTILFFFIFGGHVTTTKKQSPYYSEMLLFLVMPQGAHKLSCQKGREWIKEWKERMVCLCLLLSSIYVTLWWQGNLLLQVLHNTAEIGRPQMRKKNCPLGEGFVNICCVRNLVGSWKACWMMHLALL